MKGLEGASAGGCGTTRDVRKIERIQITGDVAWGGKRGADGGSKRRGWF